VKLYFHPSANFGDAMNLWLWPRLIPDCLDADESALLVGIGTLLDERIPAAPRKLVFGSGAGYGQRPPTVDDRWTIYCLRGPRTAQALGVDPRLAITDGAMLARLIVPSTEEAQRRVVSYIPHWESATYWDWPATCAAAGLQYIDPLQPVEAVIAQIRASRLVITEAMHGAILADTLRVPWISVHGYRHVLEWKWIDWCESLGLDHRPIVVPSLYSARGLVRRWSRVARGSGPARSLAAVLPAGIQIPDRALRPVELVASPAMQMINERRAARVVRLLRILARGNGTLSSDEASERVFDRLQTALERLRRDVARPRTG
jgi:succinoglycan biosynthesis protein ExoV